MYALMAIHHPAPERFSQALAAVQSVLDAIEGAAGMHAAYVGHDAARTQVFAITMWEDPKQFDAIFPAVQEAVNKSGIREWVIQPSRVMKFLQVPEHG